MHCWWLFDFGTTFMYNNFNWLTELVKYNIYIVYFLINEPRSVDVGL
jgi:hypothetical protein